MPAPETVARRLLVEVIRKAFLGESYDDTTYCPIAVPGVPFDPNNSTDVAPFTPAQVRDTNGYVNLSIHEVDSWDDRVTGGMYYTGGAWKMTSTTFAKLRLEHEIHAPGSADVSWVETLTELIIASYNAKTLTDAGPPAMRLRNLPGIYPPRMWAVIQDGDWRRRRVDVYFRQWIRREHAT